MNKPELRLSHIHWRVNNIKKAVKDIERLGFKEIQISELKERDFCM